MNINVHSAGASLAKKAAAVGLSVLLAAPVVGAADFGEQMESLLRAQSNKLFGVNKPLEESAPPTVGPYRTADQPASDQVALAKGLKVEYLTREAGNNADMMAFFPAANPTHLMYCVEGSRQTIAPGKLNPSVQRVNLQTGEVKTILRGLNRCDGIRTTSWGTILATEETDDGSAYEIIDPLNTNEITATARGGCGEAATFAPATPNIVKRTALPCMAWEGLAVLPSGVVIGGDELRPGTSVAGGGNGPDSDGGAIFKFVPEVPRSQQGAIGSLGQSPLASGLAFAMQVSCNGNNQQFGQGCEVGNAAWVSVRAAFARPDANTNHATGYYRPEDLEQDLLYNDPLNPSAVRFCWTNTQSESAGSFAEVMCAIDSLPLTAQANNRTVLVYRFVEGDEDFNSFDNLAFQPVSGNLYVIEDHDNGDIFACLPDGADRDIKSDGCVKVISVKDSSAEPTGFIFDPTGKVAYLSIQHSDDTNMPKVDDYDTDDILRITGFDIPGGLK